MDSSNNRRIAINTVYLYIRKLSTVIIALFTSRLLLKALGVDDFGLYGLVGSVVLMFSALRGIFSSSVQRFITISLAKDNPAEIRKIFSIGLRLHCYIAIVFFIICEGAGALLLPFLNIPSDCLTTAQWVLLFSVLSASITLITVPYDAILISYEKLDAYALISILEYILKLIIVFALFLTPQSRIIVYSILTLLVSLIIRIINSIYCVKKFGDIAKYIPVKDKQLMNEMTKFAGWNFFGNVGFSITNAGSNFILNIFGGIAINAARGIANQVINTIQQFISDLSTSFQTQTMIAYKKHEFGRYYLLMFTNSKLCFYIFSLIGFPIFAFTVPTLQLWLGNVPTSAGIFTQTILIWCMIRSLHSPIDLLFKAEARLKAYQICEFIMYIMNLPISYLTLKLGAPYYSVFIVMGCIELVNLCLILLIARHLFDFDIHRYMKNVIARLIPFIFILAVTYLLILEHINCENSLSTLVCLIGIFIYTACIGFLTIFNHTEKTKILSILRK